MNAPINTTRTKPRHRRLVLAGLACLLGLVVTTAAWAQPLSITVNGEKKRIDPVAPGKAKWVVNETWNDAAGRPLIQLVLTVTKFDGRKTSGINVVGDIIKRKAGRVSESISIGPVSGFPKRKKAKARAWTEIKAWPELVFPRRPIRPRRILLPRAQIVAGGALNGTSAGSLDSGMRTHRSVFDKVSKKTRRIAAGAGAVRWERTATFSVTFNRSCQPGSKWVLKQRRSRDMGDDAYQSLFADECPADCNADDIVDVLDFFCFVSNYHAGDPLADITDDGVVDVGDFFAFVQAFADACE